MKLRDALLAQAEATGTRVTYTDLLVFVLARRLRQNPLMNSSMTGDEIKHWEEVNIGIAVALDDGLIVPVIKNADKKSLMEISKARTVLVKKAREGKLTFAEVTGGTFTITNLGAVVKGYFFSTPIINQPESAIFGMGAITDRVVARDGQAVIRPIMTYSLTHDHRVIDGAVAAEFMAGVIGLLETPYLLMAQCTSSKS
jgi:pyruvate dehydrogenase E2 component (dihydrolipoamide acetyltransferase)